jgi:GT2 family glycosyltransferase
LSRAATKRAIEMISVVVLTHDRVHLLRKCVENVLARTSDATREIVIWDNASTDATPSYLATLTDPRIRVVSHGENIGQNGYARAFALTTEPYMVELDDDVTAAPQDWDRTLLEAYQKLPKMGFLAANLVDDPNDVASYVLHHLRPNAYPDAYQSVVENGVRLRKGPTGGGCAMTSRELHDRVGGFKEQAGSVFWLEDHAYIDEIQKLGYEAAYLEDLYVHHTGGPYYAPPSPEKDRYWGAFERNTRRKMAVKRALYRVPFLPRLNARHEWFEPPFSRDEVDSWFNPPALAAKRADDAA